MVSDLLEILLRPVDCSGRMLTGTLSVLTSIIRVGGGMLADTLTEGGENTSILSLLIMILGSVVVLDAHQYGLAVPGIILLAFGMALCNAAVFKMVPQAVPDAVGGAAGWVGGLGALGGFIIPLGLGIAVRNLGHDGCAIGFIVFIFLGLFSLALVWVLKYLRQADSSESRHLAMNTPVGHHRNDMIHAAFPLHKGCYFCDRFIAWRVQPVRPGTGRDRRCPVLGLRPDAR